MAWGLETNRSSSETANRAIETVYEREREREREMQHAKLREPES